MVSIVILNWNGLKLVSECIKSVLAQTYPEIELVVIDNASTDGSARHTKETFPQVHLIENSANLGFSKAINQGIKASSSRYVMPLNFDVVLDKNFVSEMVRAIDKDERIGSVSGKLLRLSDQGKTNIIDSTGHVIFGNRYVINRGEDEEDNGQYDRDDFVFGVCGAAPLYRREMLEDIKTDGEYFDGSFFAMLEDVDLDWRAQLRGWKCAYIPRAIAYHYRSASGVQKSRLIQRHYYKNRYLTMLKNDTFGSVFRHFLSIFLMDLYLNLDILFTAPIGLIQAWWDIFRFLPQTLRKRGTIQSQRAVAQKEIEKWFMRYSFLTDVKRKLRLQ